MLSKMPQVGVQYNLEDLLSGFSKREDDFINSLMEYLSSKYVYLVNSGIAAFYIILQALKKLSSRKEVILPAYTAPSLAVAVFKAGLRPVLCEISLTDFNLDIALLPKIVTKDTLCLVPVHMFGIPVSGIEDLKKTMPEITIIEDCAQSFGSKINGKHNGIFSDIGFTSFNRGKNLSTYGGGCIFTNSQEIAEQLRMEVDNLRKQSSFFNFILPFKMMAITLALRPFVYGALYPAIAGFKDNEVPKGFSTGRYSNFQAGVGLSLLKRIDELSIKRHQNGMALINGLADVKELIVPTISTNRKPAFNRLPIVIKNPLKREKIEKALWKAGIDTSRMYLRPIHHIFDLGYKHEDFPNASYFADRLLTLPTHPLVGQREVDRMVKIIKEYLV